jgi:Fe-S-cluster containining protein
MTIEAMNAVSVLMGDPRYSKVIEIAKGWVLEHHQVAPTYEGMIKNKFASQKVRDEWAALSTLPCPFLTETKECMIHDARPLVCMSYGVTVQGGGACPRPHGKGETLTQLMYIQSPELYNDIQRFKKHYKETRSDWTTFGFLPTLLYRAAKEKEFKLLVESNQIATAKLVGTDIDTTLMWEPQAEALWAGYSPDLVAQV